MPVLFVQDIDTSKKFYQNLFFLELENDFGENISFKDAFSLWNKQRAEEIIFQEKNDHSAKNTRKNVELYFESKNIEEIWNKLKNKDIQFIHGLKEEPWGQRTLRFFDPDNYIIEIAEPMEALIIRLFREGHSESKIALKTQLDIHIVKEVVNTQ